MGIATDRTISTISQDTYLTVLVDGFLLDRKVSGRSPRTIRYYRQALTIFISWADSQSIKEITQLTPNIIRAFLLYLEETNHNPGGVAVFYRSVRALLHWYELEFEPMEWSNPLKKVKAPKLPKQLLPPVSLEDVHALIAICDNDPVSLRDKAIFLILLDTGARASELLAVDIQDANTVTGEITIKHGKGNKQRSVFLGRKSRRALRAYLKTRTDKSPAMFITKDIERLSYEGLNTIVRRRAQKAGIAKPGIHAFRRAFAINMLRAGTDLITLQRLMGHADLQVLWRYLAQTNDDLRTAHEKGSPVDLHF
jgi:site-specific recombinase XerD